MDWIKHMFKSMTWAPNEGKSYPYDTRVVASKTTPDDEPGAILSGPYYNNFLRLLGDLIARENLSLRLTSQVSNCHHQSDSPLSDGDPAHYEEQGHIESIARDHGVMQVLTGGVSDENTNPSEIHMANLCHLSLEHLPTHCLLQKWILHRLWL